MEYLRKFSHNTTYTPKEGDELYDIHQKAIKGKKLTKEEKEFITDNIYRTYMYGTVIRFLGWEFEFSPILHKILVEFKYSPARICYAINKMYIKRNFNYIKKMTYIDCDGKVKKPYD